MCIRDSDICHTWTAEMKWKWRNDRHSELNLCNCVKKPEKKNSGLQQGLNPWPRDTVAMLYQLSYEATDAGGRSIVGSHVPMKEMSVNDIWNKSYMNCGNEISDFFTQLHKLPSLRRSFLHFQKFSLFDMFRCFKKAIWTDQQERSASIYISIQVYFFDLKE